LEQRRPTDGFTQFVMAGLVPARRPPGYRLIA
jgi:hypothetical protein